jgi:AcrR family transcriptional regulator
MTFDAMDETDEEAFLDAVDRALDEHTMGGLDIARVAEAYEGPAGEIEAAFESREALLRRAFGATYEQLAEWMREVPDDRPPRERLLALHEPFCEIAAVRPDLYDMTFHGYTTYWPASVESERELPPYRELLDCVTACIDEGHFEGADPREAADAVWNALHTIARFAVGGMYEEAGSAEAQFEQMLGEIVTRDS